MDLTLDTKYGLGALSILELTPMGLGFVSILGFGSGVRFSSLCFYLLNKLHSCNLANYNVQRRKIANLQKNIIKDPKL